MPRFTDDFDDFLNEPLEDLPESAGENQHIYTVSELAHQIELALDRSFPMVMVIGEVAETKIWRDVWMFLTLKDKEAQLSAIIMPEAFRVLEKRGHLPVEGQQFIFTGRVGFYKRRGELRFEIFDCVPAGEGELYQKYLLLKEKLDREGLFDEERKRPLPIPALHIGVVTSTDGAAVRDVLKTLHQGGFALHIEVHPPDHIRPLQPFLQEWKTGGFPLRIQIHHSLVQGEQAPADLIRALSHLDRTGNVDVIILTRGGGSLSDLWSFNDEQLARTVAACQTPVIAAIGHAKDETLCDLVADIRASTPTRAAEIIVQHNRERIERLFYFDDRLDLLVTRYLEQSETRFQSVNRVHDLVSRTLAHRMSDVAQLGFELERQVTAILERKRRLFESLTSRLSPLNLLTQNTRKRRKVQELTHLLEQHVSENLTRAVHTCEQLSLRLKQQIQFRLSLVTREWLSVRSRLSPVHLYRIQQHHENRLERLRHRWSTAILRTFEMKSQRWFQFDRRLANFDVHATLRRGFSITRDATTRAIIQSIHAVQPGTRIITRVKDGEFQSQTLSIMEEKEP